MYFDHERSSDHTNRLYMDQNSKSSCQSIYSLHLNFQRNRPLSLKKDSILTRNRRVGGDKRTPHNGYKGSSKENFTMLSDVLQLNSTPRYVYSRYF